MDYNPMLKKRSLFLLPKTGRPLPRVYWYLDDRLLDDTYQEKGQGEVRNVLNIRSLERTHTLGRLRCLAFNNNITRPVETSVQLKMLCEDIFTS